MHALAHLGPAVPHLDLTVGAEVHDRICDFFEPVAEPGVLQAERNTHRLACGNGRFVRGTNRVETLACTETTVVHDLARTPHHARCDHVAVADLPPTDAGHFGQPIHDTFHGELRLIGTETTERTTYRIVCASSNGMHVDVVDHIRAAGMTGCSFEHLHTHRCIRAGVTDHTHP